jgi:hypothetical protein
MSSVFFFLFTVLLQGGLIFGGNKWKRQDVAKNFYCKKDLALAIAVALFPLLEVELASLGCSH